jgi:hypothetical protein
MKLTRSDFLAAAVPLLVGVTAGAASARPGKIVVNGIITEVKIETGRVKIQRNGGRGSGHVGLKVVVATDERTRYLRSDETEGSFEDLEEGVKIQAKGRLNQDGSIQATRILIKIPESEE